jgi:hypothetical protein
MCNRNLFPFPFEFIEQLCKKSPCKFYLRFSLRKSFRWEDKYLIVKRFPVPVLTLAVPLNAQDFLQAA